MVAANTDAPKREGDISDSFVSLSGGNNSKLPEKFLELKKTLVNGREKRIIASWHRLLDQLRQENELVAKRGPDIVPSIEFHSLDSDISKLSGELKRRGVAIIRGVIPEGEARVFKDEIEDYVKQNPWTRAFPQDNPQVYELYWSAPQIRARSHPNLLKASTALMSLWHSSDPSSAISLSQPLSYADRLRIRQPGDATFALGPHMDGGSVERWELDGYGRGHVYDEIFEGAWEEYDPWDASRRVPAVIDNYNGLGACSMFRMFQGWLSMSRTRPFEGTLMVNPLVHLSAAYTLLRPFFQPVREAREVPRDAYLAADNWKFAGSEMTSALQGAWPGYGQEFNEDLHPHLELDKTMVHMPQVKPGDFVVWHCDVIHAVDKVHNGQSDSSVLYIPVCPVTESNAKYLLRQKNAFLDGTPGPDFPGGKGESEHANRPTPSFLESCADDNGLRAFGFKRLVAADSDGPGARSVAARANEILGF
ncbi:DUF1479 domain protein [Biscogniauxia sp. FL1348]|nr:DUF1479 domain protein [Biscogniauxia sp. FL1348]